jgi:hypothetical protein
MTVAINGTDLITLADYKTLAGISSSTEDTKLEEIIDSVSQLVKTYCGVSFLDYYSTPKTEFITRNFNTHIVELTESPVVSITSISERLSPTQDYVLLTVNQDWVLDSTTDSVFRVSGATYKSWATGPNAIKIVYTAGYSALPQDLRLAVVDLITYYHKNEQKQRQTIAGATLQNQSSTSQRGNVGFPDHIKRILDLYKMY